MRTNVGRRIAPRKERGQDLLREGQLLPTAGAILNLFLHHAQTVAITERNYRLKDRRRRRKREQKQQEQIQAQ
jgi:hypothetical protein